MEDLYGHRTAGIFGYTQLTGGYQGGQAEYARVPLGDINLLKIPPGVPDEKVLLLSDVACAAWQATVFLGHVKEGDSLCVWGCGPVGLMCMAWAQFRGASRIIGIDTDVYRLQFAREKLGVLTIDGNKLNVLDEIWEILPRGPDVVIDATAFRAAKSMGQRIQRALRLEGDNSEVLCEAVKAVRKGGRVIQIADYFSTCNNFPTGAIHLKALKFVGGQVHVQRFWQNLLELIVQGRFDPSFVITHHMPLERIAEAYSMFARHENRCIKVMLHTPYFYELQHASIASAAIPQPTQI
jgi:threonine dehydrogenase-like Zn-dependent dehydrogenase